MNTAIFSTIAQYPSVFFGKLIVEPLAGAAFAYALIWWVMRPRGIPKLPNSGRLHFLGIAITLAASALFRVVAMATFAGTSALDPPSTSGALGFYIFIVPAVFAAGYIFFLRKHFFKRPQLPGFVGEQSISRRLDSTNLEEIDDAVYANISKEIESGTLDRSLWTRLYGECDGNEAKTKAAYIRNRATRLSDAKQGSNYPKQPSQFKQNSADEDRIPIDKKVGFVIFGVIGALSIAVWIWPGSPNRKLGTVPNGNTSDIETSRKYRSPGYHYDENSKVIFRTLPTGEDASKSKGQTVELPDGTILEFSADVSQAVMEKAIRSKFPEFTK